MKNKLFDDHVKKQFEHYKPDVPAHVWENIAAKNKKKPGLFWLNVNSTMVAAVAASLLVVGAVTYYSLQHQTNNNTDIKNITANQKNNNNIIEKNNTVAPTKNTTTTTQNVNLVNNKVTNNEANENNYNNTQNKFATGNLNIGIANAPVDASLYNTNNVPSTPNSTAFSGFNNQFSAAQFIRQTNNSIGLNNIRLPKIGTIPCPKAEKEAAGSKKYIEVYAGPDYVFKTLSDTARSNYIDKRRESTKFVFAYTAGVRYTRVFGSGMSFKTGVNFSQVFERFKSVKGQVTQNVYITNNSGDTTGTYVVTGTQYKENTNKYTRVDIPIMMGYELGNGDLHANINAGVALNIYSKRKGLVLDANGNSVDLSNKSASSAYQYKTNAGVSFMAATSLYYRLNDQLQALAEPYVQLSLTPNTKNDISLKEKNNTVGLRLGFRVDL